MSQLDRILRAENELRLTAEEYFLRGKIVALCNAMLAREIGIIPGSRRLASLRWQLCDCRDEDFVTFVIIDSDTDHLPVDGERLNWSEDALQRKDKEIASAEAFYEDDALAACLKLIERFAIKDKGDTDLSGSLP